MSDPVNAEHNPYSLPSESPSTSSLPLPSPSDSGRPTGVTVFAILCFVLGGFGLLSLLASTAMLLGGGDAAANNPVFELCRTSNFYFVFTVVSTILGLVFLGVQVAAGFGLLKMAPSGRKLILAYAMYAMVMTVVSNAVNYFFLLPKMRDQMQAQAANGPAAAQQIVEASLVVGLVIGLIAALAFPIAILWYFNRSEIKAKFATAS